MKLNVASFGYKKFQRQMKHMKLEERRQFRALLADVASTALSEAKRLAPVRTGQYRISIRKKIVSNIRARIFSEGVTMNRQVNANRDSAGHGYLAGLVEYGRQSTKPYEGKHVIEKAVQYALEVHKKDIAQYVHGIFAKTFGEFGE